MARREKRFNKSKNLNGIENFLLKIMLIFDYLKADDEEDADEKEEDSEQKQTNQTDDTGQQCCNNYNRPTKCPISEDEVMN